MAVGDLVGKTINELTILKEYRENNRTWCKAECSCGKVITTRKDSITSGRTQTCGHLIYERMDITNQRFTRLLALKRVRINKEGRSIWLCKCDCSNYVEVELSQLTKGVTKSCGCLSVDTARKNIKKARGALKSQYVEGTYLHSIQDDRVISTNTSGHTGVMWCTDKNKWKAIIEFKGKTYYLGRYEDKELAIEARKDAEEKLFKPIIEQYNND